MKRSMGLEKKFGNLVMSTKGIMLMGLEKVKAN